MILVTPQGIHRAITGPDDDLEALVLRAGGGPGPVDTAGPEVVRR